MSPDTFGLLRQHMLAEVAAQTIYASARIGKAALAKPVLDAIGSVPRHEFVQNDDLGVEVPLQIDRITFPTACSSESPKETPTVLHSADAPEPCLAGGCENSTGQ